MSVTHPWPKRGARHLLRHPDGSYEFAKECFIQEIHDDIRSRYGDDTDRILDQLIGTTGRDPVARLLERSEEPAPSSPAA